ADVLEAVVAALRADALDERREARERSRPERAVERQRARRLVIVRHAEREVELFARARVVAQPPVARPVLDGARVVALLGIARRDQHADAAVAQGAALL